MGAGGCPQPPLAGPCPKEVIPGRESTTPLPASMSGPTLGKGPGPSRCWQDQSPKWTPHCCRGAPRRGRAERVPGRQAPKPPQVLSKGHSLKQWFHKGGTKPSSNPDPVFSRASQEGQNVYTDIYGRKGTLGLPDRASTLTNMVGTSQAGGLYTSKYGPSTLINS